MSKANGLLIVVLLFSALADQLPAKDRRCRSAGKHRRSFRSVSARATTPLVPLATCSVPRPKTVTPERSLAFAIATTSILVESELDGIFREWEHASAKIRTLDVRFRRYVYDTVFEVEKRSKGTFHFEQPNRGRLKLIPVKLEPGAVSNRKGSKRKPFKLIAETAVSWTWTGKQVIVRDENGNEKWKFDIPQPKPGEKIKQAGFENKLVDRMSLPQNVLPMVVDIHSGDMQKRFDWKLLKQTKTEIWLQADNPTMLGDRASFQRIKVIIDSRSYRTSAIQMIDLSGNLETVYTFTEYRVNQPQQAVPNRQP